MMQLFGLASILGLDVVTKIETSVLDATAEVNERFFLPAFDATYRDVLHDQSLRTLFGLRNQNLKRLAEVEGNQIRWLHERLWNDDIDVLLHMAQFNMEIALASLVRCEDQTSGPSAKSVLQSKGSAGRSASQASGALTRLLSITGVPDLGQLADDDERLDEVLALRDTTTAAEFRDWFHDHASSDPDGVSQAFVDLLARRGIVGFPATAVRFLLSTAAQTAVTVATGDPTAGLAVAALDAFFVERFLRRDPAPKVFLADMKEAVGKYSSRAGY
jgi:hypothetical protein